MLVLKNMKQSTLQMVGNHILLYCVSNPITVYVYKPLKFICSHVLKFMAAGIIPFHGFSLYNSKC